ncbi:hypothetical protein F2P79_008504 [Pimephales promelas]|nr:hypothetical protein F2P79_008504 [Pimephales promelas]
MSPNQWTEILKVFSHCSSSPQKKTLHGHAKSVNLSEGLIRTAGADWKRRISFDSWLNKVVLPWTCHQWRRKQGKGSMREKDR